MGPGVVALTALVCACQADPTGAGATGGVEGGAYLGTDVPLAEVDLYLVRGDTLRHQVSDADGRFAFRDLREGQYWIHVDPPVGYRKPDSEPGPIAVGVPRASTVPLTVVLLNEASRASIVASTLANTEAPDSLLPVAGITVRLYPGGSQESASQRQTGNRGVAVFSVDSGTYDLDVVLPPGTSTDDGESPRLVGIEVMAGMTVRLPPFRISTQE